MELNVLVIGSGGREHALAWKFAQASGLGKLYCAPGNPGTGSIATNLDIDVSDHQQVLAIAQERNIQLVVIGPEAPLADGLADALREHGLLVFGPDQAAARIESSKSWAKDVMHNAGVPTGNARLASTLEQASAIIESMPSSLVIKADGLAAGKGVIVCHTHAEAEAAAGLLLAGGGPILIEEYLTGLEVSLLAITDGETIIPLLPACDYKPACDADRGPNTGGMGAYAPPGAVDHMLVNHIVTSIIKPTIAEMKTRGLDYRGVLYAGLILTEQGPKVIEFNCRFGDPEIQVILPLLKSDFLDLCLATARGELHALAPLEWTAGAAVCIVLASGGYPGAYETGYEINGLDAIPKGGIIFQAGTAARNGRIVTAGGRVLNAIATGTDIRQARERAYAVADAISFEDAHRRQDIALRELDQGR